MAHCVGSLINYGALLSGITTGKIRNVVSSQLAANPMFNQFNKLKAGMIPAILEELEVSGLSVHNTEQTADQVIGVLSKDVSKLFLKYKERCRSPTCHK